MAYASSMTNERAEFDELLDKHNAVVGLSKEMKEKSSQMSQLNDRIASMLRRLDEQIDEVDLSIGTELNVLDKDRDGVISVDEVEQALELLKEKPSEDTLKDIIQKLDRDGDGKISIKELVLSIKEARQREKLEHEQ
jgi:LETM1 and EF-hand domain-containing protein 1, mitochondrial